MIDLPIGTRFYFEDKSFEVVEVMEEKKSHCEDCFLNKFKEYEHDFCGILKCSKYVKKDRTNVCFKDVKNV